MLAPCYLVHGGEPIQTEEIISEIKHLALKEGYNSNVAFDVNAQFNWEELLNKCQNLDLFADKSLVDIRLQTDNIGKPGALALEGLLLKQSPDTLILIRAPQLKPQTLNSSWVKHIQKFGKVKIAKSIPASKWSDSFKQQNPRFAVYDLSDAAINGECERTFNILHSLKDEGVDPVLILWALTREIRNLLKLKQQLQSGLNLTDSAQKLGIWRDKIPSIKKALDRLTAPQLHQFLKLSARVDTIIKGITPGNAWETLLTISLMLASGKILTMEDLNI